MKPLNKQTAKQLIFAGVFAILFLFFFGLFFLIMPYIHETGHIIFGFGDGLVQGKVNSFSISNYMVLPGTSFNILPQQTKITNGTGSLNFRLGGPIFTMIIFFALSLLGYKLSGKKAWFLLFFAIVLFEVSGNIICGTDNFYGSPLSMCNPALDISLQLLAVSLFAGVWAWMGMGRIWKYEGLFRKRS